VRQYRLVRDQKTLAEVGQAEPLGRAVTRGDVPVVGGLLRAVADAVRVAGRAARAGVQALEGTGLELLLRDRVVLDRLAVDLRARVGRATQRDEQGEQSD